MTTPATKPELALHGALFVNKPAGITSFGVIERLQRMLAEKHELRRRELPKLGHGGTLDPFATGLLIVCVGRGVKLARYFLGSRKAYEGVIRFGETTIPGDPTEEISERSEKVPESLEEIRELARKLTLQPYLQTPPMHSAKKRDGKPLYELARAGIEVEREPKLCHLHQFEIASYDRAKAEAGFSLRCSSGTYVRTLAQDLGRMLGSVALLQSLNRTESGPFSLARAMTLDEIGAATAEGRRWDGLSSWIPFDGLLEGYDRASATPEEARALMQGRGSVLFNLLKRVEPGTSSAADDLPLAIYCGEMLVAIARKENGAWGLERVFTREGA
jgi:tRNA pseudouridine55 synthase